MQKQAALLQFSIGPVQDFIAAARTVRDLWTGSYLLSWLTAHAIVELERQTGSQELLVFPDVSSNPLVDSVRLESNRRLAENALLPCLPNTFLAKLPDGLATSADEIATGCKTAVEEEWERIWESVKNELANHLAWKEFPDPLSRWKEQCEDYWDIRAEVLQGDVDAAAIQGLLCSRSASDAFVLRKELLSRMAAARKSVRRYPRHEPDTNGQRETRFKCALLGSYAQMGPVTNECSPAEFWEQVAEETKIGVTRLGKRDRLCAIALAKRFAWSAYFARFADQSREPDSQFDIGRRYPDLDTVCAEEWLARAKTATGLDRQTTRADDGKLYWSGHWLRWSDRLDGTKRDLDDPEPCPAEATWRQILAARAKFGSPPAYYAVLMLDGDGVGERVRNCNETELRQLSGTLSNFALKTARGVVESDDQQGHLIYAGGDDVLALLPTITALPRALAIDAEFRALRFPGRQTDQASLSGALVVAHYKTNWRDVLESARASEKQAKNRRREAASTRAGGWLAITVQRRSGEHATVGLPFTLAQQTKELVNDFVHGTTDRWAYKFRQVLESLPELRELQEAELCRLLKKAEGLGHAGRPADEVRDLVLQLWNGMHECQGQPGAVPQRPALDFVKLVQSASFLARGGKE